MAEKETTSSPSIAIDAYSASQSLATPTLASHSGDHTRGQETRGSGRQQHDGEEGVLHLTRDDCSHESVFLALEDESVGRLIDQHAVEGEVETVLEVPVVEVVVHVADHAIDAVLQRAQRGPLAGAVLSVSS